MQKPAQPVALWSLYKMFLYVGLLSFGGGVSAWCHREVVLVRGWMTDDEFFSGYSLAQVLPGVNSTNMAVYVGQHVRGILGSIVALIALLTGPFFAVITAATAYRYLLAVPGFQAAMAGIATAAVAMIFRLAISSARGSWRHVPSLLVLIATFVAVGVLRWPLVPVVGVLVPLSIAACWKSAPKKTPKNP
jgi:chromate transporter